MPILLIVVIAVVAAPVLGWLGTAALCGMLKGSSICGHNAYVPFVVLVPTAFFGIVYVLGVRTTKGSGDKPTV